MNLLRFTALVTVCLLMLNACQKKEAPVSASSQKKLVRHASMSNTGITTMPPITTA